MNKNNIEKNQKPSSTTHDKTKINIWQNQTISQIQKQVKFQTPQNEQLKLTKTN